MSVEDLALDTMGNSGKSDEQETERSKVISCFWPKDLQRGLTLTRQCLTPFIVSRRCLLNKQQDCLKEGRFQGLQEVAENEPMICTDLFVLDFKWMHILFFLVSLGTGTQRYTYKYTNTHTYMNKSLCCYHNWAEIIPLKCIILRILSLPQMIKSMRNLLFSQTRRSFLKG